MRTLSVDLLDILDLIDCAETYGFKSSILLCAFRDFMVTLSDKEIEEYAATFTTPKAIEQGYGEADANNAREELNEFKDQYIKDSK